MLNSLVLNSSVGRSKLAVKLRRDARSGQAVEFPSRDSDEGRLLYRITRLAALVHDLGHGPLSHTFDSFAPTRDSLRSVLNDPALSALAPFRELLAEWGMSSAGPEAAKNRRVPHEVMSCVFFAKIWRDLRLDDFTVRAVCTAILGDHAESLTGDENLRTWGPLIHDIVASAPADADRMDYMERDSRSIGVTYGLFDRNRVLKSLLCYRDDGSGYPCYRLGIKQSGLKAIENLLQARYELFAQIYYHKTNRAVSRMLEAVAKIANEELDIFDPSTHLVADWVGVYLDLGDEQFMRLLRGQCKLEMPAPIMRLGAQIADRQLWKRVLDPTAGKEADRVLATLHQEFPALGVTIQLDRNGPNALKDLDKGAPLLIRNGDGVYEAVRRRPWSSESAIIAALEEADKQFVRIYFDSSDKSMAKVLRNRALKLVFDAREEVHVAS
ncbi:MAG: hypothetical protein ABI026_03225 [Gemmatimonadaceae bacterium]